MVLIILVLFCKFFGFQKAVKDPLSVNYAAILRASRDFEVDANASYHHLSFSSQVILARGFICRKDGKVWQTIYGESADKKALQRHFFAIINKVSNEEELSFKVWINSRIRKFHVDCWDGLSTIMKGDKGKVADKVRFSFLGLMLNGQSTKRRTRFYVNDDVNKCNFCGLGNDEIEHWFGIDGFACKVIEDAAFETGLVWPPSRFSIALVFENCENIVWLTFWMAVMVAHWYLRDNVNFDDVFCRNAIRSRFKYYNFWSLEKVKVKGGRVDFDKFNFILLLKCVTLYKKRI